MGSYAIYHVAEGHIQDQLVKRSRSLAHSINHSALIARADADLQHVVERVIEENGDIRSVAVILKEDLQIIASASSGLNGFGAYSDYVLWRRLVEAISAGDFGFQIEYNKDLVLIAPLWKTHPERQTGDRAALHRPADAVGSGDDEPGYRGAILLRVDRSDVIATMANILLGLTPVSVFGILAMLALAYALLHSQVIAPINRIRRVMKQQQSGNRDARAGRQPTSELDEVALAFNGMIDAIGEREQTIRQAEVEITRHRDQLQQRVEMATRELKSKAEELKEALAREKHLNEMQRQFVSMASHEFRTPLAIIDTAAQRLKRCADKRQLSVEDTSRRVGKIRSSVQRMTRLMESTLTAARMQDGQIRIEIEPCAIAGLIEDCCARHREVATSHTISCRLGPLPDIIRADAGAVEQMLNNLLSNAVKYAPEAPDIELSAKAEGGFVVISVRDHGVGIDADDLDRIGERFFRAGTSSGIAGTGIGLNLVKSLVELHDGRFGVASQKGAGSTFTISLPIDGPVRPEQPHLNVA